jgi:spore coat polysaccharide biosynthesis predicted glycosyltransferase SpsG
MMIRLDAGHKRGMGHLFRMLLLADYLRPAGFDARFLLRDNAVSRKVLAETPFAGLFCPVDSSEEAIIDTGLEQCRRPDLWIFDVLSTRAGWVRRVKNKGIPVVCFDDLAGGPSDADLVINAIAGCWPSPPGGPQVLNGPKYAIVDPEILRLSKPRRDRRRSFQVGVTMGGSDTHGATVQLAGVLTQMADIGVTLFLGPHFLHDAELQAVLAGTDSRCEVRRAVPDLHRELVAMDAVICGGGQTLYELCGLGLPILAFANEPHEEQTIAYFERRRACVNIGSAGCTLDAAGLRDTLGRLVRGGRETDRMRARARSLVDGKGLSRIAAACRQVISLRTPGYACADTNTIYS